MGVASALPVLGGLKEQIDKFVSGVSNRLNESCISPPGVGWVERSSRTDLKMWIILVASALPVLGGLKVLATEMGGVPIEVASALPVLGGLKEQYQYSELSEQIVASALPVLGGLKENHR